MAGAIARIVRRQEHRQRGNIDRHDPPVQTLRGDDLRFAFGRIPFHLARRFDVARNDGVDADIVAAKVAGQAAGQPLNRRLGGLVQHQFGQSEVPADRPEIQDHTTARALHRRNGCLCGKEQMAQIHRHPLVPIGWRDLLDRVAIIIGGIVDQDVDAAQLRFDLRHHRLHGVDVAQVDRVENRREGRIAEARYQRFALGHRNVAKGDMRTLRDKALDQSLANPAAAAADEHPFARQAGVGCAFHASAFSLAAFSRPRSARFIISAVRP